jgi:hypothetical protein
MLQARYQGMDERKDGMSAWKVISWITLASTLSTLRGLEQAGKSRSIETM